MASSIPPTHRTVALGPDAAVESDPAGPPPAAEHVSEDGPPTLVVARSPTPPDVTNRVLVRPVQAEPVQAEPEATNRVRVRPVEEPPAAGAATARLGPQPGRPADDVSGFPAVGSEFLGFRLVEQLGRGAFGRVYLAHQGDLGGRPVALKVAPDIFGESQTLAQLQHTNIVPIYSYHRTAEFQAVCMPYFGRTTLAQVVEQLSGRPSLPASGREFVSTINRRASETATGPDSAAAPTDVAAPAALPVPTDPARSPDGWARLEGLSYVGAVLWLGGQMADGLAHAHARGILHSDLKPANVLLTDEGRPMLLDFNLAEDTKARPPAAFAGIGGTLPYMAPEHLRAFRDRVGRLDERCDVFSLGVILFELLTGRHPYPVHRGPARETIPAMLADREAAAPAVRTWNPAVSPAADAIVRKCLAPDPTARYQSAADLREDVDRHLAHLPLKHAPNPSAAERLRKWTRRHPRLSSSASVGAAAAVLLLALAAGAYTAWDRQRERTRAVEAQAAADAERAADLAALEALNEHRAKFADARLFLTARDRSAGRLDDGTGRLQALLARYGVPDDDGTAAGWLDADAVRRLPAADRDRVRADVGEAFYLMAQLDYVRAATAEPADRAARLDVAARRNAAAARYAGEGLQRAVREQRAALADLRGDPAAAKRLRDEAAAVAATARDEYLLGVQLAHQGEYRRAVVHLRAATGLDPSNFTAWFARGSVHLHLGQPELALMCYGACAAVRSDLAPVWRNRGYALARMRLFDQAVEDYDRALALNPGDPETYILRSDARFARNDLAGAEADLTRAIDTGRAPVRAYFLRADVRRHRGNAAGADADRTAGLALTPTDALSWVGRAEQRAESDPVGALADADEALKLDALQLDAMQTKAHLLTELKRPAEAKAVLDRAVALYPDSAPARAGRGVLLARAGERDAAVRDARDALLLDTRAPNTYQVACVFALTSPGRPDDRREALALLASALGTGYGLDLVDTDTDLDPLRADPEFRRVVERARQLRPAPTP